MIGRKERDHCIETQQKRVEVRGKKPREGAGRGWERIQWKLLLYLKITRKSNVNFNYQREKDLFQVYPFIK